MNKSEAVKQGTIDGAEDAELVYHEQGADDAERTLPSGTWTEIARSVSVARIMGVPDEHVGAYYLAYERAARKRVRELLADAREKKAA